ncbi:MAG: TPM domain-containing protein [Candidatus Eremiobacteraeota bacterium]|nr:TPM domain-containing protein [Candidatus Eremiobacteraeota bacterium]
MKTFGALGALLAIGLAAAQPALARDAYVQDGAQLFSAATATNLNRTIGDFDRQSGKEIVVVTEPSLNGRALKDAAEQTFAKQQVNGVLLYFAKAEKKDLIVGDRASKAFFPSGSFTTIHDAMRGYLRSGDPDQAVTTGVNLVLDQYRSHLGSSAVRHTTPVRAPAPVGSSSFGGGMSLIWLGIFLFAGFLIIRAIFRAMAGPKMMPPGYGPGGPGAPGPGYGPGGYGPGYGGGGGGGFFSGLLGGLGGAWLGNQMFGQHGANIGDAGQSAGIAGEAGSPDAGGWQSDPGQADMGNAGGGSFGDSGGGFDAGGGGGGFDGGGGGDGGW